MAEVEHGLFPASFLRQLEALDAALLRLRGTAGGGIARAGRFRGESEFKGHKPYSRGDDLRRLDWNAYGRLGKLFLREFEPERAERLTLLVDCSPSMTMGVPPKHVSARRIAAAFGFLALRRDGAAGVAGQPLVEGATRFSRLLEQLSVLEFTSRAGMGDMVLALGKARPANLVAITDGLEPLESLAPLQALSERGTAVTLVQILAPDELEPAVVGPVLLHGLEEGEALAVDLDAQAIAAYQAELTRHCEAIATIAHRHGWAYAVSDSAADLRELMLGKLLAAGAVS
jgi:uncharacterized protein (DUF58 family)